jgi:FRG domain
LASPTKSENTELGVVTNRRDAGSPPTEQRVGSWDELQHELLRDSWDRSLRRYRSNLAFRGLSNADYDLRTSLMRLGNTEASIERHLLRNFRKYAHSDFERTSEEWYWVALAQHHGLPTRLLDWTYSPHVALHFVTSNTQQYEVDGAVWCLDYYLAHERLPDQLSKILREEGSFVFTAEMLARFAASLTHLLHFARVEAA